MRSRNAYLLSRFLIVVCLISACGDSATLPTGPHVSPLTGQYSYTPSPSHFPAGKVVFSDSQFPDAVNPLFSTSFVDFEVSAALWSAPIFYDQQFHVHPNELTEVPLPENGDVRDNGKTILMHLRHDLRWSDGQPLFASDFEYWWHLDQDPNTGAVTSSGYDQIASIETPDKYTVVLHMKHPYGPYLLYLPYAAPQHAWSNLRDIDLQTIASVYFAPKVTNGPYMLANVLDGQSYNMIPNPYYTSTTFHGPFVSQLSYRSYNSVAQSLTAMQKQQTELTQGYMEYDLPQLAHVPADVTVLKTAAAAYEHLDFNNARPLFQDVRVRRAISLALNTCNILKGVLHAPDCSRLISQVEPKPSLVYDSNIPPVAYNPRAARNLLAQAGWHPNQQGMLIKEGQPFIIQLVTTAANPLRVAMAEMIREDLLSLGIQVKLAYYPLGTFFAVYNKGGILATGAFDMALFSYANSPEPDTEFNAFHSSQIPSAQNSTFGNYARISDPIIDQALIQGRNTVIFSERVQYYHQFLERLASQVYIIPLFVDLNIITVNSRLRNVISNPNSVANTWNISDWWLTR